MMRKKKLLPLAIPFMACVMFLGVSSTATATDTSVPPSSGDASGDTKPNTDVSKGIVEITQRTLPECASGSGKCEHIITGGTAADPAHYTIRVSSGHHKIILDNVYIDVSNVTDANSACAFEILPGATVDLIYKGTNSLKSGTTRAGISVVSRDNQKATLTIEEDKSNPPSASLTAESKVGGAGIGGDGVTGSAGVITIKSGKIIAKGGEPCAGIGGGYRGSAGTIQILGGDVTAKGGSGNQEGSIKGGAGIGCGSGCTSSKGEVIISGGTVKAIGGESNGVKAEGINCSTLSSGGNSATIYTNRIYEESTNMRDFNAMKWEWDGSDALDSNGNPQSYKCTVYGDAIMDRDLAADQVIEIKSGCSLAIPPDKTFSLKDNCKITGDGIFINPNLLGYGGTNCDFSVKNQRVSLSEKDIRDHMNNSKLVYSGKNVNLIDDVFYPLPTQRTDSTAPNGKYYIIDQPKEWTATANSSDGKMTNSGTYEVTFKRGGYPDIVIKDVKVAKKEINEKDMTIAYEKTVEYTGKPIEPKVTITYNKDTLIDEETEAADPTNRTQADYDVTYLSNMNVADKPKIIIKARADSQYTTPVDTDPEGLVLPFSIVEHSIANASVTLQETDEITLTEPGKYTATYNGKKYSPVVTVTLPDTNITDADYTVNIAPSDNLTDAGTYTYTIVGKGNYTGTAAQTVEFTINKKSVPLNMDGLSVEPKPYDGSPDVTLKGLTVETLTGTVDVAGTGVVLDNVTGEETSNVGNDYKKIKITSLSLPNDVDKNYVIESQPEGAVELPDGQFAVITENDAPEITVDPAKCEVTAENKFLCTVEIKDKGENTSYMYVMDDGEPQSSASFVVDPLSEHSFKAYSIDSAGRPSSGTGETDAIYFDLLDRPAPTNEEMQFASDEARALKFEADDEKLAITAELPYLEGAQYSFTGTKEEDFLPKKGDSLTIADVRFKKDCESNTEYVGYIRYAETATHKASDWVEIKGTAPKLNALPPVMTLLNEDGSELEDDTLEDNEFIRSAKVQLTSQDDNWEIYYTLTTDGSEPPEIIPNEKPAKRYTEPITIKKDTIIKAIAVDNTGKLNQSNPATETFIKVLPKLGNPSIISSNGNPFTGSTTITIKPPSEHEDAEIYYTTAEGDDGSNLRETGEKYTGEFQIYETTTVKAIAVMDDMTPSDVAQETIKKSEISISLSGILNTFDPSADALKDNKISQELYDEMKARMESEGKKTDEKTISGEIGALLAERLLFIDPRAFSNTRLAYYEYTVMAVEGTKRPRLATADDFPEEGKVFTIDYPAGTSLEANDFVIAHMFATGRDKGEIETIEKGQITKTPNGLQFTLKSASPIAIAWTDAVEGGEHSNNIGEGVNPDNPTPPDNSGDANNPNNPDNPDDPNNQDPANPDDPNNQDPANPDDPNNQNPAVRTANSSGDVVGANGTTGNGSTGSVADAIRSAAATLLPKTGDTSKIVLWIVLAGACIAVIVGVQIKSKKGKKKKH